VLSRIWFSLAALSWLVAAPVVAQVTIGNTTYWQSTVRVATPFVMENVKPLDTYTHFGPATVLVGNQGICRLPPGTPPIANCTTTGAGTKENPYRIDCGSNPIPVVDCSLPGVVWNVAAGDVLENELTFQYVSARIFDIDDNGGYDALTDGLLVIRYLFGLVGAPLIANAVGTGATRSTAADLSDYLRALGTLLDIDGNGKTDAFTDGLMLLRYMFGLRGQPLIAGAVAPDATRKTGAEIEAHIAQQMP
jgi:hypothetical protein